MSETRHELTILAVSDLERAKEFYGKAFGWPLHVEVPVYAEFELPGGAGLGLYQRESFGGNTGQVPSEVAAGGISGTELYLRTEDLPGAVERLLAAGARVLAEAEPKLWGDVVAYFADPEGNVLAVASNS